MVVIGDAVRASQRDTQRMLAKSWQTWSSYVEDANPQNGLQPDCVQLQNALGRVPAFLANGSVRDHASSKFKLRHCGSNNKNSALYINGRSTWRISEGDCHLREKVMHHQLLLGLQRSTSCKFADDSRLANWLGVQGERRDLVRGNYLAILSFAWAYILSAHWVEMQQSRDMGFASAQKDDGIHYLCVQAKWTCDADEADDLEVDLGDVEDDAARWWAAILATGEGWQATITRDGKVYRSPWSICLTAAQSFKLRTTSCRNLYNRIHTPPSSQEALRLLSDFCMLHDTGSQSSAALAATLTFPFLSNMTATLPIPKPYSRPIPSETTSMASSTISTPSCTPPSSSASGLEEDIVFEEGRLLPYYMTLSCDCRGMQSLLCGSFFDPAVSCNLVSPWLEPIFWIIDPIVEKGDYEILAMVMGKRQPKLAALWLGAIISGMARIILSYVRSGLSTVELHASAWTATKHSFISLISSTPCAVNSIEISRSDECRLLYLTEAEGHSRVPVCPWKPFGTTPLYDTEIEVRQHAKCSGHYLQYQGWCWELVDGTSRIDNGFNADMEDKEIFGIAGDTIPAGVQEDRPLKSEILSELATRSIFGWLRVTGYPRSEQDIYRHSWIDLDLEGSDEEELDDDASANGKGLRGATDISSWIEDGLNHSPPLPI